MRGLRGLEGMTLQKFRLIASSGAVALAIILAGWLGLLSYARIEQAFHQVTNISVPAMSSALRLVQQATELNSLAGTIAAAADPGAHREASRRVTALRSEMALILNDLARSTISSAQIDPLQTLTDDLFEALLDLERRVGKRLTLAKESKRAVETIDASHVALVGWLEPRIDAANVDLVIQTEKTTKNLSRKIEWLMVEGVDELQAALALRAEVNVMTGILIEAAVAPSLGFLEEASDRFGAAKAEAVNQAELLAVHQGVRDLSKRVAGLVALGEGPEGVFTKRRALLEASAGGRDAINQDPTVWTKRIFGPREAILLDLEPIIDDARFDLVLHGDSAVNDSSATINRLIDNAVATQRFYLSVEAKGNWLAGLLRQASMGGDAHQLGALAERIRSAVASLNAFENGPERTEQQMATAPSEALRRHLDPLFDLAADQGGIVDLRLADLKLEERQKASIDLTQELVVSLTKAANELAAATQADVKISSRSVDQAISRGSWLLMSLLLAILMIAGIVSFRERSVRKRLEAAADEMRDHHDRLQEIVEERTRTISEQADELRKALAAEKELTGLQRQFVSMVCHEFRTPLAIIDGNAQSLIRREDKMTAERRKDGLSKIRKSVIRLTDLMESVLSAARLEAGRIKFEPAPHSPVEMIKEVLGNHQEVNPTRKIIADLDSLPESFVMDVRLMRQVVSNLVSNAIKYSPDGARIWVDGALGDDGGVRISVRDEGVGIPSEEIDKLFERFFRASSSVGIAGTGIGLHMVKSLVEMHGGRITLESAAGEGTTFTVLLPARTYEQGRAEHGESAAV